MPQQSVEDVFEKMIEDVLSLEQTHLLTLIHCPMKERDKERPSIPCCRTNESRLEHTWKGDILCLFAPVPPIMVFVMALPNAKTAVYLVHSGALWRKFMAKTRVILADDHAIVRAGIRGFLEHAGDIEVVAEAEDGEAAKMLIQQHMPDVAVLDIQMPKASGIEVTRWVRANLRGIGLLTLTAYDDTPYVMGILQAGANGYILKTAAPEDLIQAVRDVHAGKSALDAAITQKVMAHLFDQQASSSYQQPTEREMEVLQLAAKGFTNKAIAVQLGISDRTVQGHLAHLFSKLQATSRTEAVMRGVSLGWISQSTADIPDD